MEEKSRGETGVVIPLLGDSKLKSASRPCLFVRQEAVQEVSTAYSEREGTAGKGPSSKS